MNAPREPRPIVADAIRDIELFGVRPGQRYLAKSLLGMWTRRGELTADDVRDVLDHFRGGA